MNASMVKIAKEKLERDVKDPVLRAKLTPDYAFGCRWVDEVEGFGFELTSAVE
jgi:hypothetical protein